MTIRFLLTFITYATSSISLVVLSEGKMMEFMTGFGFLMMVLLLATFFPRTSFAVDIIILYIIKQHNFQKSV